MDIPVLAQTVVSALLPFLPDLLGKATDKAAEAVGEGVGKEAFERAKSLWTMISGSASSSRVAEVAEEAVSSPADPDLLAVLRVEVRKMLERNPQIAAELATIAGRTMSVNTTTASGRGNVAIGGSADGAHIVIGSVRK
jgi:hypothetical protein